MRVVVVGIGVQGKKRQLIAGNEVVATVDPYNDDADFQSLFDVPNKAYDAALLCVPDEPKIPMLNYLVENGKAALVEKPLLAAEAESIRLLEKEAVKKGVVIYTAYNHRFEPHFVKMAELLRSGRLGKVYSCRLFYGNGTARLVRDSKWRDKGAGVLPDLGSHMLDTILFWFGRPDRPFEVVSANCFENKTPDHVVIASCWGSFRIEIELTLLMWRNHFTCDLLAEKGSAHIESLCKWGPSSFIERTRVLPSGRPEESSCVLMQGDPTWEVEYKHFSKLVESKQKCNLVNDIWLNAALSELGEAAVEKAKTC